ncbi:hypothetical protein QBC42DRAFT_314886 [Cladorrhinum samala]|uniref:Uncharacterized protein n=1 Tax=Cladorrhinum samala TaxID=585594 RepID=A0AAV9HCH4_9PEZI|nr:hypothetical protein QBC42DRAFT_314886 [Cladorrhinum samala]
MGMDAPPPSYSHHSSVSPLGGSNQANLVMTLRPHEGSLFFVSRKTSPVFFTTSHVATGFLLGARGVGSRTTDHRATNPTGQPILVDQHREGSGDAMLSALLAFAPRAITGNSTRKLWVNLTLIWLDHGASSKTWQPACNFLRSWRPECQPCIFLAAQYIELVYWTCTVPKPTGVERAGPPHGVRPAKQICRDAYSSSEVKVQRTTLSFEDPRKSITTAQGSIPLFGILPTFGFCSLHLPTAGLEPGGGRQNQSEIPLPGSPFGSLPTLSSATTRP